MLLKTFLFGKLREEAITIATNFVKNVLNTSQYIFEMRKGEGEGDIEGKRKRRESLCFVRAINNNASIRFSPIFSAPTAIFLASIDISLFLFEAALTCNEQTQQRLRALYSRVNESTAQLAIIRTKMIHGSYSECNKGRRWMDAVLARTRMNLPQRFFAEMITFAMHRSCVSVDSVIPLQAYIAPM